MAESHEDELQRWLSGDGLATLDGLLSEAVDVVGVMDRGLTIRYVNWTAPGLTRADITGKHVSALIPPDQQQAALEIYHRVLTTGVGTRFESLFKAGEELQIWEARVGPIRAGGAIIGLVVVTSNVTEQRRADADRDRFFSLSLDMLVVVSAKGLVKRANPAFGEALGYGPDELIGRPILDLVHPEDRDNTLQAFRQLGQGKALELENRYLRRNGEHRVFSWRVTLDPITSDVYGVARDVTEHRKIELQLRHAQKMDAVGQLAGGIAHDFNNLLLAILANTELASGVASNSAEVTEHLGEIASSTRRAADLTKQLLTFSRRQPLRLIAVDLDALLAGLMKMLRRLLPESIGIESIPKQGLPPVSADPSQVEQVIVNLCVNARDAMPQGGRLTIETAAVALDDRYCETHPWAKPGQYVCLRVSDTGSGMTPEVRERAFEPFFSTKAHQGTGLGLATVYGIVQQHGGLIHLYSEPGEGTTFRIYLPADARLVTQPSDKSAAAPPRGSETILIAEDEDLVRKVVVQILRRAGYTTIAVVNGVEAVRMLRETQETIHLALLDVVMPELGGPETAEQLRQLRPGLPILFATGYADQRYRNRLPAGSEVLEKPFDMDALLRHVRAALDRKA